MRDNNIREQLEKAIELQEVLTGQLIVYIKPRNKNNAIVFDTDTSGYDIIENELVFSFWDDVYKDFSIQLDNIKAVKFEEYEDMTISFICLKNGNTIMIHNMK